MSKSDQLRAMREKNYAEAQRKVRGSSVGKVLRARSGETKKGSLSAMKEALKEEELSAETRKPGRPAGPATVPLPVRVLPDLLARLDEYAAREGLTRTEAVRALIERGLR